MLVRMIKTGAGPQGVWPAGTVQDIPDEIAAALIAVGAATRLDRAPAPSPAGPVVEVADAPTARVVEKRKRGK